MEKRVYYIDTGSDQVALAHTESGYEISEDGDLYITDNGNRHILPGGWSFDKQEMLDLGAQLATEVGVRFEHY